LPAVGGHGGNGGQARPLNNRFTSDGIRSYGKTGQRDRAGGGRGRPAHAPRTAVKVLHRQRGAPGPRPLPFGRSIAYIDVGHAKTVEERGKRAVEMVGGDDKAAVPRPFRFRLRSPLVVATAVALWLGLLKWHPASAITLPIAMVLFLPFLALGRWLVRNGQPRNGLGCIASALLILAPWVTLCGIVEVHEASDGNRLVDVEVVLLSALALCGLIGFVVCFCALVPFMAEREGRLDRSEENSEENNAVAGREDEPG